MGENFFWVFTISIVVLYCGIIYASPTNITSTSSPITTTQKTPKTTTQKVYFQPRADFETTTVKANQVQDPPTFLETIQALVNLYTGGGSFSGSLNYLFQRISELLLRGFDGLRYKFTWVTHEIEYIQCVSSSLLRSNFFGRHTSILLKIFNESLTFAKNVLGDAMNEGETINNVADQILDEHDAQENRQLIKKIASREAASLMGVNQFSTCSSKYLTSIFTRVLNLLYSPTIDASTRSNNKKQ